MPAWQRHLIRTVQGHPTPTTPAELRERAAEFLAIAAVFERQLAEQGRPRPDLQLGG